MVTPQEKTAIQVKVNELVKLGNDKFHANVRDVFIRYQPINQAGLASFEKGQYILTFQEKLVSDNLEKMLEDTVPHEVAHLICFYIGMTGGPVDYKHGAQWKRICMALGGTGKATVHAAVKTAARPYKYIASDGSVVYVSTRTHNLIQNEFRVYRTKSGATITASGLAQNT